MTNENTQGNIEEGRKLEITEEARSVENQPRESAACFSAEAIERFWVKVNKDGPLPIQSLPHYSGLEQCWQWIATKGKNGYGQFWAGTRMHLAHRVSFAIAFGQVKHGKIVMHRCDNPSCVNPSHLLIGTNLENMRDAVIKGRTAKGDRSGSRTHPERRPRGQRNTSCTHPENLVRGEEQTQAKLTESNVIEIRRRYAAGGITQTSLAREFRVSQSNLHGIIYGTNWKHVEKQ